MLSYLMESSLWSIFGLVIGYLFGRTERMLRDTRRRLDIQEREEDDNGRPSVRD